MQGMLRYLYIGLCFTLFCPMTLLAMPPHPSLEGLIAQGQVKIPGFYIDPAMIATRAASKAAAKAVLAQAGISQAPLSGSIKALAVVVDFSDKVHTVTATYFDTLMFAAPVASGLGSVRDYYNKVSYGQVDIYTVNLPSSMGWVRASQTYSYYVDNNYGTDSPYPHNSQKLAEDVVDALHNAGVDFSLYDNTGSGVTAPIMLIHAGPGAEFTGSPNDIWSHSWSLQNPRTYNGVTIRDYTIMPEYWTTVNAATSDMTIGVFAHEMGHGFWSLPDLYDRTYSSNGIGDWSLMSTGSWNGPNGLGGGPAWPDAWCRVQMGFVTPTEIQGTVTGQSIPQTYNNPAPAHTVLRLSSTTLGSQEYFLIENRQQTPNTYDAYLPGSGLLIYHVDEAMWNYSLWNDNPCTVFPPCSCNPAAHFLVALLQADGLLQLEKKLSYGDTGDPFPGSTNKRAWSMATNPSPGSWYTCDGTGIGVSNISNSGAVMTADIVAGVPAWAIAVSPEALTIRCRPGQDALSQSFEVWNSGSGTLSYTITTNQPWLAVNPTNGTSTGERDTFTVTYNTTALAAGTYQGVITVSSPGVSSQQIIISLIVDTTAPTGSIVINGGNRYTNSPNVILSLYAFDPDDTIAAIQMRLGKSLPGSEIIWSNWIPYVSNVIITLDSPYDDGEKIVFAQFRDALWNTSIDTVQNSIILDTDSPNGTIIINNRSQYTNMNSVTITPSASDSSGVTNVRLSNDNIGFIDFSYSSGINWTLPTGEGKKTVYAQFKDGAGNWSDSTQASINVDTTPPVGSVAINYGSSFTKSRDVTLNLSGVDTSGISLMGLSNDNLTFIQSLFASSVPWTLTIGDGTKIVYARFKDGAGNWSKSYSASIALDTVLPRDGKLVAKPGNQKVLLDWFGFGDEYSGIKSYQLYYSTKGFTNLSPGNLIYTGMPPFVHTHIANGRTYFYKLQVEDKAGNISAGSQASATPNFIEFLPFLLMDK
jgi:M6 family metalloprotease-like protein